MAPPPPPDPAVMIDELIEQFLLRLPPEDPADLARAALVSKQWHRVVTAAVFRRRYIEFHRSAPLLGYIDNLGDSIRFVSMSPSFRPRHPQRRDVEAIHSSHGRVLLRPFPSRSVLLPPFPSRSGLLRPFPYSEADDIHLFVWDPIMNKEWELPVLGFTRPISSWGAAVVCAVGDGCSHLDCHFKVVIVGKSGGNTFSTFSCVYSSEADSWSDITFGSRADFAYSTMESVIVGNTLNFRMRSSLLAEVIFKYDLLTQQTCTIHLQCEVDMSSPKTKELSIGSRRLITTGDGRLGVAMTRKSTLCLCLREQERLAESRVIQLHGLLPDDALSGPSQDKPRVAGFADTGAGGVIFLRTCVGYFTVDLNSGRSKKVGECLGSLHIVPYVSFCTPAPGIVSTDEGVGASVVVSTDDESGAGVAVSRDEGPGDVAVSIDEGPGDAVGSTDEGPGPSKSSA